MLTLCSIDIYVTNVFVSKKFNFLTGYILPIVFTVVVLKWVPNFKKIFEYAWIRLVMLKINFMLMAYFILHYMWSPW
jgi:hypothetical protein